MDIDELDGRFVNEEKDPQKIAIIQQKIAARKLRCSR